MYDVKQKCRSCAVRCAPLCCYISSCFSLLEILNTHIRYVNTAATDCVVFYSRKHRNQWMFRFPSLEQIHLRFLRPALLLLFSHAFERMVLKRLCIASNRVLYFIAVYLLLFRVHRKTLDIYVLWILDWTGIITIIKTVSASTTLPIFSKFKHLGLNSVNNLKQYWETETSAVVIGYVIEELTIWLNL